MNNTFQYLIMQIVKHGIQIAQSILVIQIVLQKHVLISLEQLISLIVKLGYHHVHQCMIILNVWKRLVIIKTKILLYFLVILDVKDTNLIAIINQIIVAESKLVMILQILLLLIVKQDILIVYLVNQVV